MSANNTAGDLFQEAARAFRDSLSSTDSIEFTEFPSAKEMVQELNKRVSSYKKKSKLVGCCQRLERVSESLSPFFDIIGIFIQSNPEIPALVWGAMRMVFLLASNFSSFLDKLLVMFEQISDRLPGYAEYYGRLLTRQKLAEAETDLPNFESTRVLKALSYIYKDLVQFCQEACQIFGTKKRGIRFQAAAIANAFWKPFDVRFRDILARIETHQALFLSEMQLEESKFTEYQFLKSHRDSKSTHEAISQIRLQLSETQKTASEQFGRVDAETVQRAREQIASAAKDSEPSMHPGGPSLHKISPIFDTTFRQTAEWINASDFSREMNKAQEARLEDTGKWFLASSSYKAFKSQKTKPMKSRSKIPETQIMFIQGKPGYGKTILSSLLIEDLTEPSEPCTQRELEEPRILSVLYYHFASERAEDCSPTQGLRACLHQIIHHHWKTANILDAVSIVAETESTGQIRAIDEDVRQCLQLLLMKLPPLTFVFDGLDECTTPAELFGTVYELCCCTGSKAVFLGRPTFEPPRGCDSYTVISLNSLQNFRDICAYLQPEMECLKSDGLLPGFSEPEKIVTSLADRAQGMFLWAKLVVRYLSNTWLSPQERIDTILDDTMLDGLGSLFGKIIAILERSHPARQRKIHRIFQAMAISRTSFTLTELRQLIAVKPGRVTRDEDLIVDFQKCLPVMCGSLVECDSSGYVRFIHSSFRDYIMENQYCQHSPLAITKQSSWLTLTTICFSYLTYDIPRGQITTATPSSEQRAMIRECFPLLQYGVDRVLQHDHDIFNCESPPSKDELENAIELFRALEDWIQQKRSVTAWIEANFAFQQSPTLEPLMTIIEVWCLRYEIHRARAEEILSQYRQLEQDLALLRDDWTKVLLREPYAIWTSTVTAFAKSSFWVEQGNTNVTRLDRRLPAALGAGWMSNDAPTMILVKSQTAADKMTHATVHVIPSNEYMNVINQAVTSKSANLLPSQRKENADLGDLCKNWKAQYQVKEIRSHTVLFSVILDLPMTDVSEVLKTPVHPDDNQTSTPGLRFRFPVTISPDLNRVLVLRTLFSRRTSTGKGKEKQSDTDTMHSEQLRRPLTAEAPNVKNYHYESMFSPMEDAIIFFEKLQSYPRPQILEVWSRTKFSPGSAVEFVFRGRRRAQSLTEKAFLFHPNRPLLVFTGMGRTSIWYYNETEKQQFHPFIQKTIEPVAFENDVFLSYYSWNTSTDDPWVEAGDTRFDGIPVFRLRQDWPLERIELLGAHGIEKSFPPPSTSSIRHEPTKSIAVSQSQTMTTTERPGDHPQIGRSGHDDQAVMIRTTTGQTAQFGYTPPLRDYETSSMTLLPFTDSVGIVWDKELQHSYSVLDTPSPHLPCLIERNLQSIQFIEQRHSEDPGNPIDTEAGSNLVGPRPIKKRLITEEADGAIGAQKKRVNIGDTHNVRPVISIEDPDARLSIFYQSSTAGNEKAP